MKLSLRALSRETGLAIPTIRSYLTGSRVCVHLEKLQKLADKMSDLSGITITPRDIVAGKMSTNPAIKNMCERLRKL